MAMNRAFETMTRIQDGFDGIQMMGRTDPSLLDEVLARHGLSWTAEKMTEFKVLYGEILIGEMQDPERTQYVCPGILPLLEAIRSRPDAVLGLLTGNWEPTARIKLGHFRLNSFFPNGVFADDAYRREDMVPVAWSRFRDLFDWKANPKDVIVIGDTPTDIRCAAPHGATTVAVATGFHSFRELSEQHPDLVYEDLSLTDRVLADFFGSSSAASR